MCIATVYVDEAGQIEEVMQDVISVESANHGILLTTLLGEEKVLQAKVKYIDFLKHTVTIESS